MTTQGPTPTDPHTNNKHTNLTWIIPAAVLAVMLVFGAGWLAGSAYSSGTDDSGRTNTAATTTVEEHLAAPDTVPSTEPAVTEDTPEPTSGPTPATSDIKLKVKVTDKECFGSAGCNVGIKLQLSYSGPALSPDDTFAVTYEVTGGEDGPVIGTVEMSNGQYEVPQETLSTKSSKSKISAKVTGVEKVGI
jgi:hypothetical protein